MVCISTLPCKILTTTLFKLKFIYSCKTVFTLVVNRCGWVIIAMAADWWCK